MSDRRCIVLSGATGFLGSHLTKALVHAGYQVTILKRTGSDLSRLSDLLSELRQVNVDREPIDTAFEDQHIFGVIHTACNYGRQGESYSRVIDTNLGFASRLLESAIRFNTDTFVNTDTSLRKYLNGYALSKRQFVEWLQMQSHAIKIVNLRLEHMYGPGDDQTKFVPWLLERLIRNVDHVDLTPGEQLRDFVHVHDVVRAYLHLLENAPSTGFHSYDVGAGDMMPLRDFVILAKRKVSEIAQVECTTDLRFGALSYRKNEMMKPDFDLTHIHQSAWKAHTGLTDGLESLISDMLIKREVV